MPSSRAAVLVACFLLAAQACRPSVSEAVEVPYVDYAVFDLKQRELVPLPMPSDIVLLKASSVPGAQGELLAAFATNGCPAGASMFVSDCGGFPNDQALPITVPFRRVPDPRAAPAGMASAPPLDLGSIVWCPAEGCNLGLFRVPRAAATGLEILRPGGNGSDIEDVSVSYDAVTGLLSVHHRAASSNSGQPRYLPWPGGFRYVLAIRGGARGIKVGAGGGVEPWPDLYFLLQDKQLTDPANQQLLGLNGASPGEIAELEALRQGYLPILALIDGQFPRREAAVAVSFSVVSGNHVVVDPAAGLAPFPFDLMLDPATGRVGDGGARPFCQGNYLPGTTTCPLAEGLKSLDGFSTTGMVLAPVAAPISAATVPGSVYLYDLTDPQNPILVPGVGQGGAPGYVAQPPQLATDGVSLAIGLQPAVAVPVASGAYPDAYLALPPLKESTPYAVIITDGVKDPSGKGLIRSTFANVLLGTRSPLVADGRSLVSGLDAGEAQGLQEMRRLLAGVLGGRLPAGVELAQVRMAYSFRTQSITGRAAASGAPGLPGALQLAALPYDPATVQAACSVAGLTAEACRLPVPSTTQVYGGSSGPSVAAAFAKHGVDAALASPPLTQGIGVVIESRIYTYDGIDPATGAFRDPSLGVPPVARPIDLLLAAPVGGGAPTPLVIFHHGLTRSRADMLAVAGVLNEAGFAVAAIDAPLRGDRSHCSAIHLFQGATAVTPDRCTGEAPCVNLSWVECAPGPGGADCIPDAALAGQGDVAPLLPAGALVNGPLPLAAPGRCMSGSDPAPLLHAPALCLPAEASGCHEAWVAAGGAGGQAVASGEYLVSTNFFRTRDAIRQGIVDVSQLVSVLTPRPPDPVGPLLGHDIFNALLENGVILDPSRIHWLGQSYGALMGAVNLAANPRLSRGVLNAGGGTIVDIFTQSPTYAPLVGPFLRSVGVFPPGDPRFPATAQQYLTLLTLMKWVLDPADPVNFAGHLLVDPLPDLLSGGRQPPKPILSQIATCDQDVANPFNALLSGAASGSSTLISAPFRVASDGTSIPASPATSGFVQWFVDRNGPAVELPGSPFNCPAGVRVPHPFLLLWGMGLSGPDRDSSSLLTGDAQAAAASFLATGQAQPALIER